MYMYMYMYSYHLSTPEYMQSCREEGGMYPRDVLAAPPAPADIIP